MRDTGFTAVDIEIAAIGRLLREGEQLWLQLPHEPKRLLLARGARFDDLFARAGDLQEIHIKGTLHLPDDQGPPGMTVESWEPVP